MSTGVYVSVPRCRPVSAGIHSSEPVSCEAVSENGWIYRNIPNQMFPLPYKLFPVVWSLNMMSKNINVKVKSSLGSLTSNQTFTSCYIGTFIWQKGQPLKLCLGWIQICTLHESFAISHIWDINPSPSLTSQCPPWEYSAPVPRCSRWGGWLQIRIKGSQAENGYRGHAGSGECTAKDHFQRGP